MNTGPLATFDWDCLAYKQVAPQSDPTNPTVRIQIFPFIPTLKAYYNTSRSLAENELHQDLEMLGFLAASVLRCRQ